MNNPFLSDKDYDTETAIMLEKAYVHDIGNAVACTDGDRIFINTPDNLFRILPAYDDNMLKWLLWHERMHLELKHHNRFFRYLDELSAEETEDKFQVTKEEVNIIMDILVHDWMAKKFPELVETAKNNLAQFRDRNSLDYDFKEDTLEEMLNEYAEHKKEENQEEGNTEDKDGEESPDDDTKEKSEQKTTSEEEKDSSESPKEDEVKKPGDESGKVDRKDDEEPQEGSNKETRPDWSKLDDIDNKEFISEGEADRFIEEINQIKNQKIKLARLTETLNGLITGTKERTYKTPSYTQTGQRTILKGSKPSKAKLYLCFDASGSMSGEMALFKEIITKSIPQALHTPTAWFSGDTPYEIKEKCANKNIEPNEVSSSPRDYFKGVFTDFQDVHADKGYCDDGDRTIDLCYRAEQEGYAPIGITDGGYNLDWSIKKLKKLKRTIIVCNSEKWIERIKEVNPHLQVIHIKM